MFFVNTVYSKMSTEVKISSLPKSVQELDISDCVYNNSGACVCICTDTCHVVYFPFKKDGDNHYLHPGGVGDNNRNAGFLLVPVRIH